MNLPKLDNEQNMQKFVKRVEAHIVLTNRALLKDKNLNGLITLMIVFDAMRQGTTEFWKRTEYLLTEALKAKR